MNGGWEFPDIRQKEDAPLALPVRGEPFALFWNGAAEEGLVLSEPLASITGTEAGLSLDLAGRRSYWPGNPLDHLDEAFGNAVQQARDMGFRPACFAGAFHYDLRRCIERFPSPAPDDRNLPWIQWFLFTTVRPVSKDDWACLAPPPGQPQCGAFSDGLDRPAFEAGVRRIVQLEHAGEVYQVNLTRRMEASFSGDPFGLWRGRAFVARAPFSAYMDLSDYQILSLSPERLLRRKADLAWTEPIKGTAARGNTPEQDAGNLASLLAGEKEAAELAMIVDVSRNDLGRVAVPGKVRVTAHREVLSLPNVHHLVSRVQALLPPAVGTADLLRATFPGASVTGAPKISAMRIIDGLEAVSRGFYCGALGWMDLEGNFDWSLPIRTATARDGRLHLGVGGGIVVESDPAAEWEETVAKARCFVQSEEWRVRSEE
jgi:para-aminobenzoate synthetase component 1